MTTTLYGYWRSLAAFRVRAALNYKEVSFTEKIIDLSQGDQFSPSYHELNPQHVIPLLEHQGKKITNLWPSWNTSIRFGLQNLQKTLNVRKRTK